MRSAYPAVFFCALACASGPSSSARLSSTNSETAPAPVANRAASSPLRGYLMTGSFATEYFAGETLYEVLRRRAPLYLRPRANPTAEVSTHGIDPISVYINGNFSGSLEVLQSIPATEVFAVDRISATDAAMRFGPRNTGGALLVTLVRHD
jgi:hypothetical protein